MRYLVILLLLSGCDNFEQRGRYQMVVAGGSTTTEDRVWVMDTTNGRVSLCYETAAKIGCLPQGWAAESPKK